MVHPCRESGATKEIDVIKQGGAVPKGGAAPFTLGARRTKIPGSREGIKPRQAFSSRYEMNQPMLVPPSLDELRPEGHLIRTSVARQAGNGVFLRGRPLGSYQSQAVRPAYAASRREVRERENPVTALLRCQRRSETGARAVSVQFDRRIGGRFWRAANPCLTV